jgi:hypothetical protein
VPFVIRSEGPIVEATLFGVFTNADLADLAAAARAIDAGEAPLRPRITDLRDVTKLDIDFVGVAGYVADRAKTPVPDRVQSAIIAPDLPHFGFARMYQSLSENPRLVVAIFPNEVEAREWVLTPGFDLPAQPWSPRATA